MRVDVKALTGRESEVLDHLAEGRSNKDIAYRLGISARTVQKHLQRIYAKLAVKNRMAAVVLMVRNGTGHGQCF
jgi:DNA-binding NarL/FixJ family response regulator